METPKFEHDCDNCKFLGTHKEHDLYVCTSHIPTVLARYGNDGPDYKSGLSFARKPEHILFEAKERAVKLGILSEEDLKMWM